MPDPRTRQEPHETGLADCRILLVDDNQQNLELLEAYIEDLGCQIATARDGVEALRAVQDRRPDVILLDVMMPRMSGFQTCIRLKGDPVTRSIPILMVTALHEVADIERAREAGADDFVTKPVNKVDLLARVRTLARQGREQRHLRERAAGQGQP
jgi:two-component system cell cycle response regulator